ncbi:hypothetical protein J3R82DRAFT_10161 [Butyriboletus roseoflavus]|nr:hypothetical protein J3R82DRAFT_10161 [Butyriboletus roseoflavus]
MARQLMDPDPEVRPKMATVLKWMTLAQRGEDNVMSPALGITRITSEGPSTEVEPRPRGRLESATCRHQDPGGSAAAHAELDAVVGRA